MKKLVKKTFVILLAILMVTFIAQVPIMASEEARLESTEKFDDALKEKLESVNADEKINVSVWFKNIDETKLKRNITETLSMTKSSESNSYKAEPVVANIKTNSQVISEKQEVIEVSRSCAKDLYESSNDDFSDELMRVADIDSDAVIYSCSYAPNIDLSLTEDEIYRIAQHPEVDRIYLTVTPISEENSTDYDAQSVSENTSAADTQDCLDAVWATYLRDTLGKTGSGIKIGMIDNNLPTVEFHTLRNSTIYLDESAINHTGIDVHANSVATILVGRTLISGSEEYVGVVPDATLYCTTPRDSTNESTGWKERSEWLISQGVNIINISSAFRDDGQTEDNDFSKWIDHIVYQHDITVVIAAGYFGTSTNSDVSPFNYAYNAISVGNIRLRKSNGDYIFLHNQESAHSSSGIYFPQVVAPGIIANIIGFSSDYDQNSFSSPLVVGCIAQLMQEFPELLTSPTLVKSVIMAGADGRRSSTATDPSGIYMDRVYGAGVVNVLRSRNCMLAADKTYQSSYSANGSAAVNLRLTITDDGPVRLVLNWSRMANVTHAYNGISLYPISHLKLTVRSPQGTEYSSYHLGNTFQVIKFTPDPTDSGDYTITISRTGPTGYYTDYSLAVFGDAFITEI